MLSVLPLQWAFQYNDNTNSSLFLFSFSCVDIQFCNLYSILSVKKLFYILRVKL